MNMRMLGLVLLYKLKRVMVKGMGMAKEMKKERETLMVFQSMWRMALELGWM
jgi:hypothetical protein